MMLKLTWQFSQASVDVIPALDSLVGTSCAQTSKLYTQWNNEKLKTILTERIRRQLLRKVDMASDPSARSATGGRSNLDPNDAA